MVLPRLFNTASRSAFAATKRNLMFSKGLATAAPTAGKVRYVLLWIDQRGTKDTNESSSN